MTDPRAPIFAAVRQQARPGLFNDPGNVLALDNLLDAFDVPRAGPALARYAVTKPDAFFTAVRKITGKLDQVQVDTINGLLTSAAHWPLGWMAYGFGTAWHEALLKPIEEWGKGKGKRYGQPDARMKPKAGLPTYGGQIPYGRGLVQLTWVENYEWADKALGLNGTLLKNFARALEPDIATAILVRGMEEGAFTGKKLADYLPGWRGSEPQFRNARRIINGTDRDADIAALALRFQDALAEGGWA